VSTPEQVHDLALCDLYRELAKAEQKVEWALSTLRHVSRPKGVRFDRDDNRGLSTIVSDVQAMIEAGDARTNYGMKRPSELLNEYDDKLATLVLARFDIGQHEQAYTGWQRFYLVTSSAGLVHSSMQCSTCNKGRKQTTFALVASFSGTPVKQVVEAVGPLLCSVCWPDAPVTWVEQDRIPARVAEVLFDQGYDAFKAEWEKFQAKRAARAAK
jgi:hypothetical protein